MFYNNMGVNNRQSGSRKIATAVFSKLDRRAYGA